MPGFQTPLEPIKQLVDALQTQERKLNNDGLMPMKEQYAIHNEIKRLKAEIAKLERRVGIAAY